MKVSLKSAQQSANAIGMRINKTEYGEYRVTVAQSRIPDYTVREASAYYTDDLHDAVQTMHAMCAEMENTP